MNNEHVKKNEVFRTQLVGGVVSLIKVIDEQEFTNEDDIVLMRDKTKKIIAIDIRKGVFEAINGYGTDVLFSLSRKEDYCYKIIGPNTLNKLENNTIVLRDVRELNDVLDFAGVKFRVSRSKLGTIKKAVLSSDEFLQMQKHTRGICKEGIINTSKVIKTNKQAASLLEFKRIELPTKPQQIEKVYAKHFK